MSKKIKKDGGAWGGVINVLVNVLFPSLILIKLSGAGMLGPTWGFILAITLPLSYGLVSLVKSKTINVFSALGLISVLMTGGVGLLRLAPKWVAVKEAAIPLLIGVAILASLKTKFPLVRTILGSVLNLQKIEEKMGVKNAYIFEKQMVKTTYIVSGAYFLSAILNFTLAKLIVVSMPGSGAFNQELGRMTALSFPVIVVPTVVVFLFAIWYLISGIKKHADIEIEEILKKG